MSEATVETAVEPTVSHYSARQMQNPAQGYEIVEKATGKVVAKAIGDIMTLRTVVLLFEVHYRHSLIDLAYAEIDFLKTRIPTSVQ